MFVIVKKSKVILYTITFLCVTIILSSTCYIWKKNNEIRHLNNKAPEYYIIIEIDEKALYLFDEDKCIKKYPISSGKPGWPSPIGEWKIADKGSWGEEFGGRWMGLNVSWGNYGIHGTTKEISIGRAASHGCIRMYNKDVKELYDIVSVGTPVIIRNGPYGPFGTGFRSLNPGDRGADVLAVQKKMKKLGYFKGHLTGIYEDDLKIAVHQFQKDNSLNVKNAITQEDYHKMGFMEFE